LTVPDALTVAAAATVGFVNVPAKLPVAIIAMTTLVAARGHGVATRYFIRSFVDNCATAPTFCCAAFEAKF
jgi:hypothetical protein